MRKMMKFERKMKRMEQRKKKQAKYMSKHVPVRDLERARCEPGPYYRS